MKDKGEKGRTQVDFKKTTLKIILLKLTDWGVEFSIMFCDLILYRAGKHYTPIHKVQGTLVVHIK